MGASKPSKRPMRQIAVAGLLLLAASLAVRTCWLMAPYKQPSADEQRQAVREAARKRLCGVTPPQQLQSGRLGRRQAAVTKQWSIPASKHALSATSPGQSQNGSSPVTWQEIEALIGQPSGVHGQLEKAGLPGNWRSAMQHMVNMDPRLAVGLPSRATSNITRWMQATQRWRQGSLNGTNAQLRSPIPSCHYLVDHTNQVIFVRTTKIGGTTLANVLGITNHPVACRWSPYGCKKGCVGRPFCLTYMTDPEAVARVWQKYTVFGFVRNPWSRAISSYHFNNKRAIKRPFQGSFANFAAAPSEKGALCRSRMACCNERYGFVLEHVEAQTTSCLFTAEGLPAVDFIGRSERLDEDFGELVELLNSRRPPGLEPLNITISERLNSLATAASEVDKRRLYAQHYVNNSALCDIHSYFEDDFKLLQYPQAGL